MIDRKEDNQFHLVSKYEPSGDQPQAIEALVDNIEGGEKAQILKGATGTGKTYTMSQVIQRVNKPTLVMLFWMVAWGISVVTIFNSPLARVSQSSK